MKLDKTQKGDRHMKLKRTFEVEDEQQSVGLEKRTRVLTLFSAFSGKEEPNLAVIPL